MGFRAKYGLILEDQLGTDVPTQTKWHSYTFVEAKKTCTKGSESDTIFIHHHLPVACFQVQGCEDPSPIKKIQGIINSWKAM